MTTPQEEHYALIRARQFLVDLIDPKKTPRVPKYVREEARARVKHFPIMGGYLEKYGPHDHDHLDPLLKYGPHDHDHLEVDETAKRLKEIAEIDRKYRVFERLKNNERTT